MYAPRTPMLLLSNNPRTGPRPATDRKIQEIGMNPSNDQRLRALTCVAFTRSPALARRAQAHAVAELVSALRVWVREARMRFRHAGPVGATGHAGATGG